MFAGTVKEVDGSRRDREIKEEKSKMLEEGRPPDWFTKFAAKKKINVVEGHLEGKEGGQPQVRFICWTTETNDWKDPRRTFG